MDEERNLLRREVGWSRAVPRGAAQPATNPCMNERPGVAKPE